MTKKLIHVPQGAGALVSKSLVNDSIEGIYTDQFSTCCIVVTLGRDQILLVHADTQTDTLALCDAICKIEEGVTYILHKPQANRALKTLIHNLTVGMKIFEKTFMLNTELLSENIHAILVYTHARFNDPSVIINSQIKLRSKIDFIEDQARIIMHPFAARFSAKISIEEFLFAIAFDKSNIPVKQPFSFLLYKNNRWETLTPSALNVNCHTPQSKKVFTEFSQTDDRQEISRKIINAYKEIEKKRGGYSYNYYLYIDNYAQCFLHYFNIETIHTFENIHEYLLIFKRYDEIRQQELNRAQLIVKDEASTAFRNNDFEKALNAFRRVLNIRLLYTTSNSDSIPVTLYNIGRCYQNLNCHAEAIATFNEALTLRQTSVKSTFEDLCKLREKISESEQAMSLHLSVM